MDLLKRFDNKIIEKRIPVYCAFELTNRCNIKCRICFQNQPRNDELTTDEVKDILDQLADMGCLFLTITGGEPLLRKDFFEIIRYAVKKTFAITLKTNATLITPTVAEKMNSLPFHRIHISLLGATAKTHDKITGVEGSFEKVISAVKLLKKKSIITLATTVTKENICELNKMKLLADSLEVNWLSSALIYPRKDGGCSHLNARLADEDLKKYYSYLFKPYAKEIRESEEKAFLTCVAGVIDISITHIGEVTPCTCFPMILGNLKESSLNEILTSSAELKHLRSVSVRDLKECSRCDYKLYCRRCPAMVYLENNTVTDSSLECCRHAKIIKEVIGK
ncbi:MAG: radical SAM protein [bacterium]